MAARVGSDKWLFFTTLLLIVVGLAMVFSASAVVAQERYHSEFAYVGRQAGWALAGVMAMLVLMNIDTSFYNSPRVIFPLLAVTTLLLVMVFLFPDSHNTHRWIRFGGLFTFQPSEIAKPVLVQMCIRDRPRSEVDHLPRKVAAKLRYICVVAIQKHHTACRQRCHQLKLRTSDPRLALSKVLHVCRPHIRHHAPVWLSLIHI